MSAASEWARESAPPITVILNPGSGHADKDAVRASIEAEMQGVGREHRILAAGSPQEIEEHARAVVREAHGEPHILAAAGGDGTINTVAGVVVGSGVTFGVIPLGTFNYFARDLGIPLEPAAAARAMCLGKLRQVHVATVNGHLFLNNASFGLYRHLLEEREEAKQRFGRYKLIAVLAALHTMWRHRHVYTVQLQIDGRDVTVRTPMVFFGLNTLQLEKLDLEVASCTEQGLLAVIVLKPTSWWKMIGLAFRGALQGLRDVPNLRCYGAAGVKVTLPGRRTMRVAVDGESIDCRLPLEVRIRKHALTVVVPNDPEPRR